MPKFDLTVTVSVIIALCAIISPILTALINNHYLLKMKKLELSQEHYKNTIAYQRNIFENYLKYAGRCTAYTDENALRDYGEYYLLALMYAPKELHSKMISLHTFMRTYKWTDATHALEEITPEIHAILQKL